MKRFLKQVRGLLLFPAMVVALAALAACGGPSTPAATPTPASTLTPTPVPTAAPPGLTILSPQDGATAPPGDIVVTINTANFNIVSKLSQPAVPGEGHVHFYKDVDALTTPGQAAVTTPGTYAAGTGTSHTWAGVTPGVHTFSVQLVNNNHTPLEPPVVAKITVTVQAEATPTPVPAVPGVTIVAPQEGATVPPGDIVVTINTTNFNIVSKLSQPAVPGEGHVHFYKDVDAPTTPGQPAVTSPAGSYAAGTGTSHTWAGVTPGAHTFSVQLVNNDHTPLEPPVVAKITVTVQAAATPTPAAPGVTIVAPQDGATVSPGDIVITINATNFNIVSKLNQPVVPGEGHVHFYKDVDAPTIPGQPAVTSPAGSYAAGTGTSHTWAGVTPGAHTFSVQLVNNNHTPLEPPVVAKITVTVQAAAAPTPAPSPTGAAASVSMVGFSFSPPTITVPVGTVVTWTNDSSIFHTVTSDDGSWDSGNLDPGQTYSHTFDQAGTFSYHCTYHVTIYNMVGTVIVQ